MAGSTFSAFAQSCRDHRPEVFVVLGSGLGAIVDRIGRFATIPFSAIPGVPESSVVGHRGQWTLGRLGGRVVLVSEGRLHYYEGHSWEMVCLPIRIAAALGVQFALLTNAAGGIRDDLRPGSLLPIRDHLEWNRPNPWREPARPSPYSARLAELMCRKDPDLRPGVYGVVTGPSYETPAEIRALRSGGADAVGMSTSREILAGVAAGLECGAISLITNRAAGLSSTAPDHREVLAAGKASASRLADLLEGVIADLSPREVGKKGRIGDAAITEKRTPHTPP